MYSASIVDSATISHWRSKSKNWPERDRRKTNKQGPLRIMQSTSLAILAGSLMGFAAFHAWHMLCKLWSVIPAFLVRHPLAALWADEQRRIFNCCAWKSWIKYSTGAPLQLKYNQLSAAAPFNGLNYGEKVTFVRTQLLLITYLSVRSRALAAILGELCAFREWSDMPQMPLGFGVFNQRCRVLQEHHCSIAFKVRFALPKSSCLFCSVCASSFFLFFCSLCSLNTITSQWGKRLVTYSIAFTEKGSRCCS